MNMNEYVNIHEYAFTRRLDAVNPEIQAKMYFSWQNSTHLKLFPRKGGISGPDSSHAHIYVVYIYMFMNKFMFTSS